MGIDERGPLMDRAGRNVHELEPEAQVLDFVDPFKRQRVLVADPADRRRLAEPERPDEEVLELVDHSYDLVLAGLTRAQRNELIT